MAWTKAQLRQKIKDLKKKRNNFEDRRDDVKKAYDKCYDLDDYKSKIEKKIDNCTDELRDGINWISALSGKCETIENNADGALLRCRGTYASAMDRMSDEIDRCNAKIDSLTNEIRYYQYLLDTAED